MIEFYNLVWVLVCVRYELNMYLILLVVFISRLRNVIMFYDRAFSFVFLLDLYKDKYECDMI